jgi:hypothetical protein
MSARHGPEDVELARLAAAWQAAGRMGTGAAERAAGLPAELRTLGAAQVLVALKREGEDELARLVARRMAIQLPAWTGRPEDSDPRDVANFWAENATRQDLLRVEADLVGWAADLKLLLKLRRRSDPAPLLRDVGAGRDSFLGHAGARSRSTADPTFAAQREQDHALGAADRAAARACDALAELPRLEGCASRCRALPVELREQGLVRTLAVLAREAERGSERLASDRLLSSLHRRLVEQLGEAMSLAELVGRLLQPGPTPAVLEALAVAWAQELKRWLDIAEHGEDA